MRAFAEKPKATQQATSPKATVPARSHFGNSHEVNSILHLQRTIGNQAVQQLLQSNAEERNTALTDTTSPQFGHDFSRIPVSPPTAGAIQTKLAINRPGDAYEQEACRVAEQVMRMPEPRPQRACACGGACPKCQTEQPDRRNESLQRKRVQASDTGQIAAPPIVDKVLRSPGQPLDPATRTFMEPRFGYDFSRVRVHTGAAAEQSARDVNAHAYTVGHDVVFGAGRFAPGTQGGRRLIAHELAHTVQQSDGAPPAIAREPKEPPFAVNQQDMVYLQKTMLKFYNLLTADERASLQRNTTVVIALVTHENKPTLVYTVASNSTNPGIRAAAGQLGLTRWDPEGINKIAGERHAEQLTVEAASKLGFKVHGIAVTREPCRDCGPVIAQKGIPIVWVRDPHPAPRGSGGQVTVPGGQVTVPGGTGPSVRSAIGWGLAVLAINLVLGKILGRILQAHHERQVQDTWNRLLPKVQQDLTLRQASIEKLLRETKGQKTIYANVLMDMIVIQSCWQGGCTEGYYGMDFVPPVKVSTEDINRMDPFSSIDPAPAGNIIHRPVTFSFPIAEPSADVLPHIWTIHQMLSRIRTDLKAVRGGTAGEAVALDNLNVALEATEYTRATVFQSRSAADRFQITVREVDSSISVLGGLSNPAIKELVKRLGSVRFLLQHGLAHRWPIMV